MILEDFNYLFLVSFVVGNTKSFSQLIGSLSTPGDELHLAAYGNHLGNTLLFAAYYMQAHATSCLMQKLMESHFTRAAMQPACCQNAAYGELDRLNMMVRSELK